MMTITPFTTFNSNYRKPYRDFYYTPVYDETDIIGDFDDDGNCDFIDNDDDDDGGGKGIRITQPIAVPSGA